MELKYIIIFLAIIKYSNCAGGQLRKTPKVYNALITTDDNLQSSRAFPVIQPTIHETGIAHYPFGPFNDYRYFSPPLIHTGPQGYHPSEQESPIGLQGSLSEAGFPQFPPQFQFPHGQPGFPPLGNPHNFGEFPPQGYGEFPQGQPGFPPQGFPQFPQAQPGFQPQSQQPNPQPQDNQLNSNKKTVKNSPSTQRPQSIKQGAQQKQDQLPVIQGGQRPPPPPQPAPIPLNQFGYPPSLIPLQSFYHPSQNQPENHINLQPYPFNNYPLIPDQFNPFPPPQQFHQGNYLPPFNNYPDTFGVYQAPKKPKKKLRKPSTAATPTTIPKAAESDIAADLNDDTKIERNQNNADEIILSDNSMTLGGFVKNGASNLNSDVPDVPPPPLPAGNVQN